jgi:hypothetical protein
LIKTPISLNPTDQVRLLLPIGTNSSEKTVSDLIDDQYYYWKLNQSQLPPERKPDWKTGRDPLSLWAAIVLCHESQTVFPDWVRHDLARIAKIFLGWVTQPPTKGSVPVGVAKILDFNYGRPFTHWKALNRNHALFLRYETIRLGGTDRSAALEKLANEKPRASVASVTRYLDNFSRAFGARYVDDLVAARQVFDLDVDPHSRVADPGYRHRPPRGTGRPPPQWRGRTDAANKGKGGSCPMDFEARVRQVIPIYMAAAAGRPPPQCRERTGAAAPC